MAPTGKRKRNAGDPGEGRPSPHRPQNTGLGQHDRGAEMRDGNRRSSRGGQGGMGRGGRRNDGRENPNKVNIAGNGRATPTTGPMSPPAPRSSSATQTPIPTPTPAPSADIPSPVPRRDPLPFEYTFLTDDRLASWDASGRQEVVAVGVQARKDEDAMDLASIVQELVRSTLDGRIDPTAAGLCVKDILGPDASAEDDLSNFDPHTTFLDIFSMLYDAEEGPMNPSLRSFVFSTGLSPQLMRQKLDGPFLQELGLTRDTFLRVGVRQATNLLYRQANYNLLREESEGYSKLVTELFTTSASEPPSSEVVEDTFERVKALIGTFDLDVGRVLDITLDVFAAVLIKHFRFFIKLLRISSWWPRSVEIDGIALSRCEGLPTWALPTSFGWMPEKEEEELQKIQRRDRDTLFWARAREIGLDAFFELGGRQLVDEETKKRLLGGKRESEAELDAERQWIETTGTLPPSGNRIAAQLLGFKLRFYASAACDEDDKFAPNLIYLTALLIKVGFISLRDLYPHLWPLDEDMKGVKEARLQELAEKEKASRGVSANALTMAGALPDDTLPNNGRSRETAAKPDPTAKVAGETENKGPEDQKVLLLTCLLTIGAIPESLFILGRFPWLTEAYPELIDLINRILNYSIKDVYEMSRPQSAAHAECPSIKVADSDQTGIPKGQVRLTQLPIKKQLRWPFPDKSDTNDNLSYRFYWDEWADNVPVCQTVDDIFTLCDTFLNLAGVSIGKDVTLLSKLARIGAASLVSDNSQPNLERWEDLLKRLLVPALSLTKSNTSVVNEIYDLLRFYPVSIRYAIYAEWFEGPTSRQPAMKIAFARAKYETEKTMKRISKTNLTAMARTLAKTAYSCPGVVFRIALSQIEAYTNLTEVVVECAKNFTDLGYDVLVWSLLTALGGKDRNRNNDEFALLPSRWLLALSRFSGKVFRRYSIMNLSPIIQYVNEQLFRGNSTDLVILKELIAQMSGIVPDTDYNDAQLAAMTGGEALRKQTLINLQDKRYESTKTSKRLMRGLVDTGLAGELLIGIAQYRQVAIYNVPDQDAHIKLLATMVDDTQMILFQYLDLLRSSLSPEDFDKQVPSIPELLEDFGLDPTMAFLIGRAGLAYRRSKIPISAQAGTAKSLPATTSEMDAEGDVGMEEKDASMKTSGEEAATILTNGNSTPQEDTTMHDTKEESPSQIVSQGKSQALTTDPYQEIMEPIIAAVQKVLPEGTFKSLSPDFYSFFWASSLGDLAIPSNSYDTEISRLLAKQQEKPVIDRSDSSRAQAIARKENEESKKAAHESREAILREFRSAVTSFGLKKGRLLRNKSSWFDKSVKPDDMSVALLEKCLLPRLLLSPTDADYSFKMIKFLHDNGVPQFRTLSLYGQIFKANRLRSIIFTCTVREAECLGRFLKQALSDLARWHKDVSVYEKEAWGKNLPGFAKALDEDGKPKGFLAHDDNKSGFKSILYHWHKNLNTALRQCFEGTEWMHIRNAITILKAVVDVFPAVDFMGNGFIKQLNTITEREKKENNGREDLSLTGNGVLVQLKKRQKHWVMVQAFANVLVDSSQTNGSPANGKPGSTAVSRSALKPTAQEFKPQSRASSLGISTSKPTTEVEDGEVDDAKLATPSTPGPTKGVLTNDNTPEPNPLLLAAAVTIESKKSDILDRREQIKRENAAKATASSPGPVIPRSDSARSSTLDRSSPSLPNRPDAPFPSRDLIDRHQQRHSDRRDVRESRLPDPRGLDRVGPRLLERGREFSGGDRRGPDPSPRDFGRPSDRSSGNDRERVRPEPPPRWIADSSRENLDRINNGPRGADIDRLSRDVPLVRPSGPPIDRGPIGNPDRIHLVNPERQEIINPERAALISGEKNVSRSNSPRRGRDDVRDRGVPRPPSPRRTEKDVLDPRRDDRRNAPVDTYNISRIRAEEIHPPPAGPRGDRPLDRDRNTAPDRSAFQAFQTGPRPMDPDHGRLNSGARFQPDPNFGRLNPVPSTEIPLGPRDRTSRGTRPGNPAPPPRRDGQPDIPRPPTPEKQPPTGPSGRHPRRSASGQIDQNIAGPGNPGSMLSASAIHPDRLAQLGGSSAQQTPQQPSPLAQVSTPPIHPDRMRAFGSETNPSLPVSQMGNSRTRQQPPSVVTSGPPSGPKGAQSSPVAPAVNGFTAPTGPASASDRNNRGGRRQLAGINTMLQQAGQQLNTPDRVNARGRGRLSSGIGPETPISGPSTPVTLPPPPGPPPPRHDSLRETNRELMNPERVDLFTGGVPLNDDRERDRKGRREHSGRHSHRTSRSPGRERESKHGVPDDRSQRNDYRERSDRRSGDSDRDRHRAATSTKDVMVGRETGSRDSGRDREHRDRESIRRDGREREVVRDPNEAGWSGERVGAERGERGSEKGGRSRDMRGEARGEDRRDSRGNREDGGSGRKRRSDEGALDARGHHDKRPRRV